MEQLNLVAQDPQDLLRPENVVGKIPTKMVENENPQLHEKCLIFFNAHVSDINDDATSDRTLTDCAILL